MTFLSELLPVVVPIIVAGLTTVLFEKFQQGVTALEKAPAIVKQLTVAVLAYGLTKAAAVTGVALTSGDPTALTAQDFNALLSSGLAFLFHQGTKSKALASKLGALLLIVGLAACTPSPAVASPRPFGAPLEIVADTVRLTFAPCDADEPTVACRVTVAGTVGQTPIVFPAVADVAVGGTAVVTATFACTALQTISVTATSRGVNRSGQVSAPQTATATTQCADGAPNVPRSFTITVTVVRP